MLFVSADSLNRESCSDARFYGFKMATVVAIDKLITHCNREFQIYQFLFLHARRRFTLFLVDFDIKTDFCFNLIFIRKRVIIYYTFMNTWIS